MDPSFITAYRLVWLEEMPRFRVAVLDCTAAIPDSSGKRRAKAARNPVTARNLFVWVRTSWEVASVALLAIESRASRQQGAVFRS
jgi:hypothetical protein